MVELYDEFFSMLRLTKSLYEYGMEEQMQKWSGSYKLDGDNYWELVYEAIGWVFRDTRRYYNERLEFETWLFFDPAVDRFCQLCHEYEERMGISEEKNHYRRDIEQIIREGFSFNSYDYDYSWRLSTEDRGRRCLLLFTGCEFYSYDEIFEGLVEIKDGFEALNERLSRESVTQWKEAA